MTHTLSNSFIGVTYITFVLLALWSLAMTYFVGPGYCREIFKSVPLDPVGDNEDDEDVLLGDEAPNRGSDDANPNEGEEQQLNTSTA